MFFTTINDAEGVLPELKLGGPTVGSDETTFLSVLMNEPNAFVALEDWPSGAVSSWAFWHDEIHFVVSGEAEITYTLPPNHTKMQSRRCGPGDLYLILSGTRAQWEVKSNDAYRHVCIVMPRYEYDRRLLKQEI